MGALLYNPFPILNCFRAEMHVCLELADSLHILQDNPPQKYVKGIDPPWARMIQGHMYGEFSTKTDTNLPVKSEDDIQKFPRVL